MCNWFFTKPNKLAPLKSELSITVHNLLSRTACCFDQSLDSVQFELEIIEGKGNELSPAFQECLIFRDRRQPEVLWVPDATYSIVLGHDPSDHGSRAVCRGIVDDDEL